MKLSHASAPGVTSHAHGAGAGPREQHRCNAALRPTTVDLIGRRNTPLHAHVVVGGRRSHDGRMAKYLISFPSAAMVVDEADLPAVAADAHAVIREAKAAGVYVFGGGIDEDVPPVLVAADGTVAPATTHLDGGFCVLELPTREEATSWAARIAAACRTPQELRQFQYDPES